jgi:hypothetical protein
MSFNKLFIEKEHKIIAPVGGKILYSVKIFSQRWYNRDFTEPTIISSHPVNTLHNLWSTVPHVKLLYFINATGVYLLCSCGKHIKYLKINIKTCILKYGT